MKILIATDGSEFSRRAIEKSCRLLNSAGDMQIKILSVYEQLMPMATEPFAVSAPYYQEMTELARRQCETFATDSARLVNNMFGDAQVETKVVMGAPSNVIVEEAANWGADLIVVGSHGRGFWGRLTLGSVSDAVIHHAPCSVLIARG